MRFLAALFLILAVAQAYDTDWDNLVDLTVIPEGYEDLVPHEAPQIEADFERITNGDDATPGQFPYQVALFIRTSAGTGFCGGSILNEEWILTAAHCVDDTDDVDVVLGAHNIREDEPNQIVVKSSKIIVHENWDARGVKNDVAVIKLASPIEYNDWIQPTRLASRDQASRTFAHETGIVSGWGRVAGGTGVHHLLQYTTNPIATNAVCNLFYFGQIISNQICKAARGGRSACNGDSGGPLVVVDSDGLRTQVGVVSHGIALGCTSGWPGVYSRVTHFVDWIEANTGLEF